MENSLGIINLTPDTSFWDYHIKQMIADMSFIRTKFVNALFGQDFSSLDSVIGNLRDHSSPSSVAMKY